MFIKVIIFIAIWVIVIAFEANRIIRQVNNIEKILTEGIEVEAVVTKTESHGRNNADCSTYVKFVGDDKKKHEALVGGNGVLPVGEKIIVKYIPGQYKLVALPQKD